MFKFFTLPLHCHGHIFVDIAYYKALCSSLVHEVRGVLAVPFGIAHSSGMEERILFGTETEVALSLKLGYNDPKVAVENPSKKKLVLEFQPVRKDMEGQSQRMFYVR